MTQIERPRIELKSITHNASLSEETHCYSATLYVDGEKWGTVANRGHGGSDEFHGVGGRTWHDLKALDERDGFAAFTLDKGFDTDAPDDWKLGWQTAWTRCYGQGVKCAAAYDADEGADADEATNPYPQFSAAWEAWASGFDDFEAL